MTNTGKIARLPHALREQLNHRLRDAEPAEPLLQWLNTLPEVQKILADQFAGQPITPQNLSQWRTGAFAEWCLRKEILGDLQSTDETATAINEVSNHRLANQLLTILTARYASFLNKWDGEITPAISQKLKALSRLNRDLNTLRKAAQPAKSDLIKPNQASPGVGTARPHISPGSPAPSAILSATASATAEARTKAAALAEVDPALAASVLKTLDFVHETLDLKAPALDLTAGNVDSVLSFALNQTKSKYPQLKMADLKAAQPKA